MNDSLPVSSRPFGFRLFIAALIWAASAGIGAEPLSYFRSDAGRPANTEGPLPSNLEPERNLVWKQPLDSGHSTPTICGDRIFLTAFRTKPAEELSTMALDRGTGRILWKRITPTNQIEPYHRTGSPAAPTVACDGERIYSFFGSYGLLCYDLEGDLVWKKPLGPFQQEFGAGSSPILAEGMLLLNQDHDVDSFLMAVDCRTGETLWKTARPDAVRSYSTPMVWERAGRKEIIVAGALELNSYDLNTGSPLWWAHGLARIVIPIPTAGPDLLYAASWAPGGDTGQRIALEPWKEAASNWDKNGDGEIAKAELDEGPVMSRFYRMDLNQNQALDQQEWERHASVFQNAQNAVLALDPKGRGDLTDSAVAWSYNRGIPYVASPLYHEGALWMVKDGGIVTKLDANTGELLHQERIPAIGNYYASPVAADGKIFFASEQGVLTIVADVEDWVVLSTHDFDERIYATPVVDGSRIFIRTEEALYCFEENAIQ